MTKCMIHNGFCELHMTDLNDEGKCPVGEVHPEVVQPKVTMCEICGHFPAMEDDFICCECFEQMVIKMGGEDL